MQSLQLVPLLQHFLQGLESNAPAVQTQFDQVRETASDVLDFQFIEVFLSSARVDQSETGDIGVLFEKQDPEVKVEAEQGQ